MKDLYGVGYGSGQADAVALRLDTPEKHRDARFREGYVAGYANYVPVYVSEVYLFRASHFTRRADVCFWVVTDPNPAAPDRGPGSTYRVGLTGKAWNVRRPINPSARRFGPLVRRWVKRLWLSYPAEYRGLANDMANRKDVRGFFQDYLDDARHPQASFLRHAWAPGNEWIVYPFRLPDVSDGCQVLHDQWDDCRHWCYQKGEQWIRCCAYDLPARFGSDGPCDKPEAACCLTCYRRRPFHQE